MEFSHCGRSGGEGSRWQVIDKKSFRFKVIVSEALKLGMEQEVRGHREASWRGTSASTNTFSLLCLLYILLGCCQASCKKCVLVILAVLEAYTLQQVGYAKLILEESKVKLHN